MERALRRHDEHARTAVGRHGGRIVKTTGDGMHAVFDDPLNAVDAAIAFLVDLATLSQESGVALRARCGMPP